ncbi:MAG: AraC family transcriptional regulator [Actinomycetota bacterium]
MSDAMDFDFDYRTRPGSGPLAPIVESVWFARGTVPYRRERIAPTGSTVAIVVLGDPIVQIGDDGRGARHVADRGSLIGPHDGPIVNEPQGETHAVGIVTTPIGCAAAFGVAPASIRGEVVDLDPVWSPARALRQELLRLDDPDAKVDLVVDRLSSSIRPLTDREVTVGRAVDLVLADPTRPIPDVADAIGWSPGHLSRVFADVVGLTPRVLARLLRLRRLLHDLDVHGEIRWSELAVEWGWCDQAHLIRDLKRHVGVTPAQYVEAQAIYRGVEDSEPAGFVPEPG